MTDKSSDSGDERVNEDAELIAKIKQRDSTALAVYMDRHRDSLSRFVRSITGEHLLAVVELDDLVQEVSATAVTSLHSAPLDQYEPMQWLQQIARRRIVDTHRFHFDAKRRDVSRQQSIHSPASPDASMVGLEALLAASMTSPSAVVSRDFRMEKVHAAILELSEEQQTAIRMRYGEGVSTKSIAEHLGKTDAATRVLLSRSMRSLEQRLQDVKPSRP